LIYKTNGVFARVCAVFDSIEQTASRLISSLKNTHISQKKHKKQPTVPNIGVGVSVV